MAAGKIKKKIKKPKKCTIWGHIKKYLENSSIHGLKYLVEEDRHWSERVFWIVCCICAWFFCLFVIHATIKHFLTSRVAITIDTNYPLWSEQFPAIHMCMTYSNLAKEYAIVTAKINRRKSSTAARYSSWIGFGYDERNPPLTPEQYREFMNKIMPECTDLFGVCDYNGVIIDCCKIFVPLKTTFGQCLSFNSLQAPRPYDPQLTELFSVKHYDPISVLSVFINSTNYWLQSRGNFHMMITSQINLPTFVGNKETVGSISNDRSLIFDINQTPMANDAGVKAMSMNDRKCRFPHETEGFITLKAYSFEGCILENQMRRYKKICDCLSHVFPPHEAYNGCNVSGLICGNENLSKILNIPVDDCMIECDENTIDVTKNNNHDESDIPEWATNKLEFNLLPGPYQRYSRYTVQSDVDLVVAVGSALGLFVGVGILSVVEIFYWLFLR